MKEISRSNAAPQLTPDVTGSDDPDFAVGLLEHLVTIGANAGVPDADGTLFAMAIVRGIEPRDQIEAMLAAQMAATQNAIMMLYRQLSMTQSIEVQESAEKSLGRMSRLYMQQMEALKRYRDNRPKQFVVSSVTVNEGGQAFLGVDENFSEAHRLPAPGLQSPALELQATSKVRK